MSCNIARKSKKSFQNTKLTKGIYHYDKSNPNNLKLPLNIDKVKGGILNKIISKMVKKYRSIGYKDFNREQLEEHKEWNDLQILFLIKFYKNDWSIKIPDEDKFFPHFVFTYNEAPLKKRIDMIVSYCHDHIE